MAKVIPRISITVPIGAPAETRMSDPHQISGNVGVHQGILCTVKVVTPNWTSAATCLVKIYDRNGILLWTSAAIAKNSGAVGNITYVDIPLVYGEYVTVTPSIDIVGGAAVVTIDMDYIPDHFMEVT
jgi:hypothetical protein